MPKKISNCIFPLFLLLAGSPGCGQKGPLYLENPADTANREKKAREEEERQKTLEGLTPRNDSQPDLTY
ncbi:MAG: LPS translocon maturation chaperone LptM [Gammaproteobacteria bacterium]